MIVRFAPPLMSALMTAFLAFLVALPVAAADRNKVEAFLSVTGFDVALDSIRLTAGSAPDMLGIDADEFGSDWTRMAPSCFSTTTL